MKKYLFTLLLLLPLLALPGLTASAADEDPYLSRQTNLTQIDYFPVWERGFDGSGVTIAVIDTGAFIQHEELRSGNVFPTVNMLPGGVDPAGDSNGHGTFIAGQLAAVRGNGVGIAGMVDGASILPFRCFTGEDETDLDYVVRAIYSAVDDYGCDVINLSVGMSRDAGSLRAAVDHAVETGAIVIAAVGNEGTAAMNYPAAYDNVVGVGSVDGANNISRFSQRNGSVFVVAPGEDLVSTGIQSARSYVSWDGTSFACVHATALAAVAKQYDKSIDAARFMLLLRQSAADLGPAGYDETYGWGLLNAAAFLDAMFAENAENKPETGPGPVIAPDPGTETGTPDYDGRFADIAGHWAEGEITEAVERGLFGGMTDTEFRPDYTLSRAMAAAILYRLAGSPEVRGPVFEYADVLGGTWYSDAVAWAWEAGVFSGDGFALFRPDDPLTRQEFAVVICRFARWQGRDVTATAPPDYADADAIAPWARENAAWCREKGLITGLTPTEFCPEYGVSRAMAAAILVRYMNMT